MTFIGKMLVVVQLVLSLLFMAFAGAVFTVEQNWKQQFADKVQELKEQQKLQESKTKEHNDYKTAATAEIKKITELSNTRNDDLTKLQAVYKKDLNGYNDLKTEEATQRTVAKLETEEAGFRRDEAIEQRQVNTALHDDLVASVRMNRDLEETIFNLNLQMGHTEQRHLVVLDDLKTARLLARRKGRGLGALPSADIQPPPPLNGKVVSSRYGIGNRILYVEISVGGDDGIKEGQLLTIFRSGDGAAQKTKYLGQVRIIHVFPDKAVGTVREKAKNGVISKGDNVTSKL